MTNKLQSRLSNMELLRIVCMFFVLVQHANFLSIGTPVQQDAAAEPVGTFIRFFVEALCIVAVNVFVFISGWFGIRYSHKGVLRLFFQCVFFAVVSFCIAFLLPPHTISVSPCNILKGYCC